MTIAALFRNDLSAAFTLGTNSNCFLRAEKALYHLADSSRPMTGGACVECRAILGTCSVAMLALYVGRNLKSLVDTLCNLIEVSLTVILKSEPRR